MSEATPALGRGWSLEYAREFAGGVASRATKNGRLADAARALREPGPGGTAPKCGGGKISLNNEEAAVFSPHNRIRKERNLGSLCVHPALQKAARAHSEDMIRRDYFSHDDEGGRTFDARLKSFGYDPKGYPYYLVGENIAFGSGSYGEPENIMDAWMESDGHHRNILKKEFREIGVGAYTGTYKTRKGSPCTRPISASADAEPPGAKAALPPSTVL